MTHADRVVARIVLAREEARVCVDQAAAVAEEVAGIDTDLQASRDAGQRAQLASLLRYTAAACSIAEQRAVRAVFVLRMEERSLEDAHALMVRGQREDVERVRIAARGRAPSSPTGAH